MRGSALAPWFLPLFVFGCGLQSAGPVIPDPTAAPARSENTGLSLGGRVYAASEARVDAMTKLPTGYRLAPDGTQVSYRLPGSSNWKSVATKDGEYLFESVPRSALEVRASFPGLGSRTLEVIPSAQLKVLDFSEKNSCFLVDAPEVVGLTPALSPKWDPSKPLVIAIRFSEEIDPASFDPKAFSLRSSDITGLSITDGTALFGAKVRVTLKGDTVTIATNAPLADIRGLRYPQVFLRYGRGVLQGKTPVLGNSVVSGYNLDGKKSETSEEIAIRFWTDDSRPGLKRVVAVRNGQGYDVRFVFTEPMVVMLNEEAASGSFDPRVLSGNSYLLQASASVPVTLSLSDLAFDPGDPSIVRGRISSVSNSLPARPDPLLEDPEESLPVAPRPLVPLSSLTVRLLDLSDPAGNPASGSAKVSF
ncbi:MAG TPA: hypothetical protein DD435_01655 [Cyanobacteria bacterium UBA8530]|nr:hypothetical protein [Cyanobacteria bacterium UBA8530]